MHYQFLMGADRRGPYDYVMLVAGPLPVLDWAKRHRDLVGAFSPDGAFTGATADSAPQLDPIS
jgi:hypothetical protein